MVEEPKSIVVVEDDAGMRKALERLLRVAGYKTELFPSAEAMIAAQAADSADCLILDIHLPGISGIELLRRLSASGRRSPVIFITAQDDDAAREEARQLDCVAYLRKPFDGTVLLAAIRQGLLAHTSN